MLHLGHLKMFHWVKDQFGYVIAAVNTDEFVLRYKGKAPIFNLEHRMGLLKELRCVDEVVVNEGDEDSKLAIMKVRPDVIVNGTDWTVERLKKQMGLSDEFLKAMGIEIAIFPNSDPIRSTGIRGRL